MWIGNDFEEGSRMIVEALYTYSSGKTKEQVRKYMQKVSSVAISLFCCIYILILKFCLVLVK